MNKLLIFILKLNSKTIPNDNVEFRNENSPIILFQNVNSLI